MQEDLQIQRFAFDRTFTLPPRETPRKYRRKTDPALLAQEVEDLRQQIERLEQDHTQELARTRAEAFEAGRNHMQADREAAILSALDALQASLEESAEQDRAMRAQVVAEACEMALAAAEAIAGHATGHEPGGAVDEAIGRALAQVKRGQEIDVRVHPDLVEDIEARIAQRQSQDRRRLALIVSPDETLSPGDGVLSWDRGGVIVDAQRRRRAVLDELAPLLPSVAD
ncbi:FliH/SctL family protein [Alteriqipengyuania sp. 357]